MEIIERFKKYNDEYLKFERISNKKFNTIKWDVYAFMLLDQLFPFASQNMIVSVEHDLIYLSIAENQIKELTDDQIIELIRCGILYDDEYKCLVMSV